MFNIRINNTKGKHSYHVDKTVQDFPKERLNSPLTIQVENNNLSLFKLAITNNFE